MATIAELKQALLTAHNLGAEEHARIIAAEIARQAGITPVDPMEGMSGLQRSLVGSGAEITDWGRAIRQRAARPLNAIGAVSDETMGRINAEDESKKQIDARLGSDIGANVGRLTANLAAPLGVATRTAAGAGALGTVLGALIPTDDEKQAVINMLASGAFGAAGQALGNKIVSAFTGRGKPPPLNPEELALVKQAKERYNLTPAQITGSPMWRSAETQLASLPGSAGDMAARRGAQRELFNADLFSTFGEPPRASVVPGTVDRVKRNFTDKYARATGGVQMQMDSPLFHDLVGVLQQHERYLPPDQSKLAMEYITTIPKDFNGAEYQLWRARFGQQAEGATGPLKDMYKGFQRALDAAFDRQAPQTARSAMTQTRGEYRNWKTAEPLVKQAEARGDDVRPMMLAQRVADEGNLGGELADLGRVGRRIGAEGPNSGTAQNLFWQRVLTGSMPFGAAGAGAGAGYALGGTPEAAMAGGATALASSLVAPKIAGRLYLSQALRDATVKSAEKASQRAISPTLLARVLRQLGSDGELAIEALSRGGALALPSLLDQQ